MGYPMNTNANEIIRLLGLIPHPEGGFFKEIYRSQESISRDALPERYNGQRAICTSIFYLLTPNTFSTMHKVRSDELFHFYLGDRVEQLRLYQNGSSEIVYLGQDIAAGDQIQSAVPAGVWQGARLAPGSKFALLGATVAPGFDFDDYEEGTRKELSQAFPEVAGLIECLTRR